MPLHFAPQLRQGESWQLPFQLDHADDDDADDDADDDDPDDADEDDGDDDYD